MFSRRRKVLTLTLAHAALAPHLEMERRLDLDWAPRLLDDDGRRAVEAAMEYHGANLPCGTPPERLAGRRESTRWPRLV